MGRMMNHAEASELLGAYALDAVEGDEAEAVAAHLELCPRCRDELRNHLEVVGLLAYAGQAAPEGMWDRVAARLSEAPAEPGPADRPVLRIVHEDGSSAERPAGAGRGRRWLTGVTSLVAAAALVVVAALGLEVAHLQGRTNHLSGQLAAMSGQPTMADVRHALVVPGARVAELKPVEGGSATLAAVVLPDGGGYLYDSKLAPLPASQTYQLWGVVGGQRISYGVLGSVPEPVTYFRVSAGVEALAVTAEVAGGVVSSVHQPVAVSGI